MFQERYQFSLNEYEDEFAMMKASDESAVVAHKVFETVELMEVSRSSIPTSEAASTCRRSLPQHSTPRLAIDIQTTHAGLAAR